jgi:hypothetical protein
MHTKQGEGNTYEAKLALFMSATLYHSKNPLHPAWYREHPISITGCIHMIA